MFRIRKVMDSRAPGNAAAVAEAQAILHSQFSGMDPDEIEKLPQKLADPFTHQFLAQMFVAEDGRSRVRAAALLLHDPRLAFAYLDMIATIPTARSGSGIGGALYERIRQEASELNAKGLYFECLPDDPDTSPDPATRRQNAQRLKFYERFGAFPILGTAYQAPISPGDTDMPFLVFDGLGKHELPSAQDLREITRAILERKYRDLCPPDYVAMVLDSIRDGMFAPRPARYVRPGPAADPAPGRRPIPVIVNDKHDIHHIRERGYVESPVRIPAIASEREKTGLFATTQPRHFGDRWVREVHDPGLVDYLERACLEAPEKKSIYPYVFPARNAARRPKERSVLAGYWCIDTFTPLNRNAWPAARRAVDCALTAADLVLNGAPAAYALVRPPGHHAERRTFGGFCYLCNGAIAANYLARFGRVAILDIDYHHGNGQQDIFYERADVLTVSIHGDPSFAYPYFTGFRGETGRNAGAGFNLNLPLPETVTPEMYRETLTKALDRIREFGPTHLVLSLGFDTGRGDPTGTWANRPTDFHRIGEMIGDAGYPTVIIQEGGYRMRTIGANAREFFRGLSEGQERVRRNPRQPAKRHDGRGRTTWRNSVRASDPQRLRQLVAATGKFSAEETAIAEELGAERIARGRASGYEFVLVEQGDTLLGFACFGRIPGSETSWDLYWIAVHPDHQGKGLGGQILARSETAMHRAGAEQVFVDTSTVELYEPTRRFYQSKGYALAAEFADFYRPGDGKAIFRKGLSA